MATTNDILKKKQLQPQQTVSAQPAAVQNQNAQQKELQTQSDGVQLPKNNPQTSNWSASGKGYNLYQTPEYEAIDYSKRVSELGGGAYAPSQNVQAAQQYLQSIVQGQPGAFKSNYTQQLSDLYNQIMTRDPFTYDFNADALYQQAKDQYIQQGQMAMRDTMAQAAAMTGGYGNSYANTAGQQAYQGYLQQLSAIMPEYYDRAYQRYMQEGQNLMDRYNLTQSADQLDYAKHRDTVADWQANRAYAQGAYESERGFDYNNYATQLNKAMNLLGYERDDNLTNFEYQRDDSLRAEGYGYQDYSRDQEFAQEENMFNRQAEQEENMFNLQARQEENMFNLQAAQEEKMFNMQAALEREMLAAQQAYQDSVRNAGYAREDALLQNQYAREDALRQEGYNRYDQQLADERAYNQQLLDDERAYNQYLTQDQRAYNQYLTQDQRDYNQSLTQDQRDYEAGLRQEGYSREDQQLLKSYANDLAMQMIAAGAMPTTDLLAVAGIGEADALALAKKYGYKEGGSGSGSGGSGKYDNSGNKDKQTVQDKVNSNLNENTSGSNYNNAVKFATGGIGTGLIKTPDWLKNIFK